MPAPRPYPDHTEGRSEGTTAEVPHPALPILHLRGQAELTVSTGWPQAARTDSFITGSPGYLKSH